MKVGPYELGAPIGSGATGTVYRARGPRGEDVAVKILERLSASAVARFDRERRLHEALGAEQGFVPFVDAGEGQGGPWLAMPFVPGGTLRERLGRGRLGVEAALGIVTALARAIARAHDLGVVHRDLKPENIIFTANDDPLVADLGLAKHLEGDAAQAPGFSRTGELQGTAGYAPPEQIHDAKSAGPAADVFALGAILYECLAGTPPFVAPNVVALLARVESGEYPPLVRAQPAAPPWLVELVGRCLDPSPERRFRDAGALARALAARGKKVGRRPRATGPLLGALGALVAALAFLGFAIARSRNPAPPTPTPGPGPAVPPPSGPLDPSLAKAPPWFLALDPAARPRKLPAGVVFGKKSGEYVNEKDESVLVHVPAGRFLVGAEPRTTGGFFLGKHEVTNYQFAGFVAATSHVTHAERAGGGHVVVESADGRYDGSSWKSPRGQSGSAPPARHPVLQVWWTDAVAYATWAGLRLPTLDEWQKAAGWDPSTQRARVFPWGDQAPGAVVVPVGNLADQSFLRKWLAPPTDASAYDDGHERSAAVDAFSQSVSPCGALEMGGNAAEWIADAYDRKRGHDSTDDLVDRIAGVSYRLVGGSFADYPPDKACRVLSPPRRPRAPREDYGFRVCRSEE